MKLVLLSFRVTIRFRSLAFVWLSEEGVGFFGTLSKHAIAFLVVILS